MGCRMDDTKTRGDVKQKLDELVSFQRLAPLNSWMAVIAPCQQKTRSATTRSPSTSPLTGDQFLKKSRTRPPRVPVADFPPRLWYRSATPIGGIEETKEPSCHRPRNRVA